MEVGTYVSRPLGESQLVLAEKQVVFCPAATRRVRRAGCEGLVGCRWQRLVVARVAIVPTGRLLFVFQIRGSGIGTCCQLPVGREFTRALFARGSRK